MINGKGGARLTTAAIAIAVYANGAHADTAPPQAESQGQLTEIIVTAQKRSENLQKVPLAITALSANQLRDQQVVNPNDLTRVVPDLLVNSGGAAGDNGSSQSVFSIRGLGASGQSLLGSPAVAVHLDSHYLQTGLSENEFFDVDHVEVAPGPQGTLFGRSAAAGAVNIITQKPTNAFEGEAGLELGNYGEVRGFGAVNLPVTDTLALRFSGQYQSHDGYFTNGYNDMDSGAIRGQILWKPDDAFSAHILIQYLHNGGIGTSPIFVGASAAPLKLSGDVFSQSVADYSYQGGRLQHVLASVDDTKFDMIAEFAYNFGPAILTISPTFERFIDDNTNNPLSQPYASFTISGPAEQKSVEIRLNDPGDTKLKWVAGGSYFTYGTDAVIRPNVVPNPFVPTRIGPISSPLEVEAIDYDYNTDQNSKAVFGQATYPVLDELRLTLGARQNWDDSNYLGQLGNNAILVAPINLLSPPFGPGPILSPLLKSKASFGQTTWKAAVDYDLTPTSLVYGTVGRGYKPGGLNETGPASSNIPPTNLAPSQMFAPETVTHYELGTKNRLLNNRLQVNDAIYFDRYKNYQNLNNQLASPIAFGVIGAVTTNAGEAHVYGNELSLDYKLTPNDRLTASLNYLHAKFASYLLPAYLSSGNIVVPAQNFSGYKLPNAPSWSGTFSYLHSFDLPDDATLTALVSSYLTTSYFAYFQEQPGTKQGAYSKTLLSLTYESGENDYSVSLFVKNLENHATLIAGSYTAPFTYVYLDAPRLFGVTLTKNF